MATAARNVFGEKLEEFRKVKGLTQTELARKLGIGQPHLSRLISGGAEPGDKLRVRTKAMIDHASETPSDEWMRKVAATAARSPEFRRLVNSALKIVGRYGGK